MQTAEHERAAAEKWEINSAAENSANKINRELATFQKTRARLFVSE